MIVIYSKYLFDNVLKSQLYLFLLVAGDMPIIIQTCAGTEAPPKPKSKAKAKGKALVAPASPVAPES